jgi:hypothetical protein
MFTKISALSKKMLLVVVVLAIGLAAIPLTNAYAAGLNQETTPPQGNNNRLEKIWAREVAAYNKAEARLAKSNEFIGKVQDAIKKANEKGWDTSTVQTALDAFKAAVRDARPLLNSANGIVTSHKGFDDSGKVTDRTQAIETVKELGQHLKDARVAMGGTGKALLGAIKAFREAHHSTQVPTTTP